MGCADTINVHSTTTYTVNSTMWEKPTKAYLSWNFLAALVGLNQIVSNVERFYNCQKTLLQCGQITILAFINSM